MINEQLEFQDSPPPIPVKMMEIHERPLWNWRTVSFPPVIFVMTLFLFRTFLTSPRSSPDPGYHVSVAAVSESPLRWHWSDCAEIESLRGVWEVREYWVQGLPIRSKTKNVPWMPPDRLFLYIDDKSFHFVSYYPKNTFPSQQPGRKHDWEILQERYPVFGIDGLGTVNLCHTSFEVMLKYPGVHLEKDGHPGRWKLDGDVLTLALLYKNSFDKPLIRPEMTDKPGTELWYVLDRFDRVHDDLPVYDITPTSLPSSMIPVEKTKYPPVRRSDHPGFESGTISSRADLSKLPEEIRQELESPFVPREPQPKLRLGDDAPPRPR